MSEKDDSKVLVIPNDVFFNSVTETLSAGTDVVLTVKGYSMFPFMRNGKDKVCLEKYDGGKLSEGDVILFRYHGKHILHRIYGISTTPDGSLLYRTMGDGNVRGMEYARAGDLSGVMVSRISPSGREWRCSTASWRFCSSAWMRLYRVRRWCLAVMRRIYR